MYKDFGGAFSCIRFDKLEWDWILILMEIYAKFDTSLEQKSTMDFSLNFLSVQWYSNRKYFILQILTY